MWPLIRNSGGKCVGESLACGYIQELEGAGQSRAYAKNSPKIHIGHVTLYSEWEPAHACCNEITRAMEWCLGLQEVSKSRQKRPYKLDSEVLLKGLDPAKTKLVFKRAARHCPESKSASSWACNYTGLDPHHPASAPRGSWPGFSPLSLDLSAESWQGPCRGKPGRGPYSSPEWIPASIEHILQFNLSRPIII